MKTLFMLAALVTSGSFCAHGQTNARTVEKALLDLNRAWAQAVTRIDAAALEKIFSDDIVVTWGSGSIRNKAEEIKDATANSDPYFIWMRPFTTENERVRIYNNDAAVVTGLVKWTFKYQGEEVNEERRYSHFYVKEKGQWKIVAQQFSGNLYKKP